VKNRWQLIEPRNGPRISTEQNTEPAAQLSGRSRDSDRALAGGETEKRFARRRNGRTTTPVTRLSTRCKLSRGATTPQRRRENRERESKPWAREPQKEKTIRKPVARAPKRGRSSHGVSVVRKRDSGGDVSEGSSSLHGAPADEGYRKKNKRRRSASAEKKKPNPTAREPKRQMKTDRAAAAGVKQRETKNQTVAARFGTGETLAPLKRTRRR
jgi:hypothetical protein